MSEPGDGSSVVLPASFFTELLPAIGDLGELRVTLSMYYRVQLGMPLVAETDLVNDVSLRQGLVPPGSARDPAEVLQRALEQAVTRGTLLAVRPADQADRRCWYTLGTPAGQALVATLTIDAERRRELLGAPEPSVTIEQPNIFRLYERHIAVLTPLVAQQLAEAATEYPPGWIIDAFAEAVARERRSWRYIQYLLDRWASEGQDHATPRRHAAQPLNPDKYTKGKYAAIFQR